MKILQLLLLSIVISSSLAEPPTKKPIGYPNRPHKNVQRPLPFSAGRRTLVLQIRSDSPVPIVLKRPSRHQLLPHGMRPVKLALSPQFFLKSAPLIGKHIRKPTALMKIKLSNNKPQGEYVYEKPFSPAPEIDKHPIDNSIHLAHDHYGPIHTIPAPNLGNKDKIIHQEKPLLTPRPNIHHQQQYQVIEEHTNDHTIIDPHSGQQKYFAPDPDPSLPAPKVPISTDPYSTPSNGQPLPSDIQPNFISSATAASQVPHQFLQFINPMTQQQLPDTYGVPIANQPQLQQYIFQQASSAQRIPLAVYNPTYLVTQSNSLYNQHQQQLFKPNPNYMGSLKTDYAPIDLTQEVASEGQILQAGKDAVNYLQSEDNSLQEAGSQSNPSFAALVGNPTEYNIVDNVIDQDATRVNQQHTPSQGYIESTPLQGGFVVSNYFGNTQEPTSHQEQTRLNQAQYENHLKLQQTNHQLQQLGQNSHQYPAGQENVPSSASAYEEHQRLLQQHLGPSSLRIFVPDEEYQTENGLTIQKRSDDYSEEQITEEDTNSSIDASRENRKRD